MEILAWCVSLCTSRTSRVKIHFFRVSPLITGRPTRCDGRTPSVNGKQLFCAINETMQITPPNLLLESNGLQIELEWYSLIKWRKFIRARFTAKSCVNRLPSPKLGYFGSECLWAQQSSVSKTEVTACVWSPAQDRLPLYHKEDTQWPLGAFTTGVVSALSSRPPYYCQFLLPKSRAGNWTLLEPMFSQLP